MTRQRIGPFPFYQSNNFSLTANQRNMTSTAEASEWQPRNWFRLGRARHYPTFCQSNARLGQQQLPLLGFVRWVNASVFDFDRIVQFPYKLIEDFGILFGLDFSAEIVHFFLFFGCHHAPKMKELLPEIV